MFNKTQISFLTGASIEAACHLLGKASSIGIKADEVRLIEALLDFIAERMDAVGEDPSAWTPSDCLADVMGPSTRDSS